MHGERVIRRPPPPTAVQLVCIDAEGERADYENGQGRRVDKPKFGYARLAVWTIGDLRGDSVAVCEGAADALALAARDPDPVCRHPDDTASTHRLAGCALSVRLRNPLAGYG